MSGADARGSEATRREHLRPQVVDALQQAQGVVGFRVIEVFGVELSFEPAPAPVSGHEKCGSCGGE
jgi:hypothetical protein